MLALRLLISFQWNAFISLRFWQNSSEQNKNSQFVLQPSFSFEDGVIVTFIIILTWMELITENNKDLKGPVWKFLKRIQVESEGPWEKDRILWDDGEGWPQASQSYLVVPMC